MTFMPERSINQTVQFNPNFKVELAVKREDLIHPVISGNKFRKLKYNLEKAQKQKHKTLLTFGGAFSNHIAAVAEVGKEFGFRTIGIIRGDELWKCIDQNPTLHYAQQSGMHFKFVTREAYRKKNTEEFIKNLKSEFGDFYLLPEGGTNALAIKGCEEILAPSDTDFDYICCAVGTGGTISGLINCLKPGQQVLGFPAFKGDFLKEDIGKFVNKKNWKLIDDYHFGGYAKINEKLISFINEFKNAHGIPLDPIYTGKMMFGLLDLIKNKYFSEGSKILAIHTGGLQGIEGMNMTLRKKGWPLIH